MRRSFDYLSFFGLLVVSLLEVKGRADIGATPPSAFRVPADAAAWHQILHRLPQKQSPDSSGDSGN